MGTSMREVKLADAREWRDTVRIYGIALVLAIAGFAFAFRFVDPAPPTRLVIATGGPAGAYHQFGERYREVLAREGIEVEVRSTAGSIENLGLLARGEVEVAFVQGGTAGGAPPGLVSLASLYYEPVWVFVRPGLDADSLAALGGARIAIGPEGSGTRALAQLLLADVGLSGGAETLLPAGGTAAVDAMLGGEADAVVLVASPRAEAVTRLLHAPGVRLLGIRRAEAFRRLHRFLSPVTLPAGLVDLRRDLPSADVTLLAATANLVARADLHPAIADLLMQAADEIHRDGGFFEEAGQFPSAAHVEFPLSDEARRFFRSGPPFLQRYLPFWAATLIDRMKVLLVPLIALALPLIRVLPPVYRWRVRSRIYRWYREIGALEEAATHGRAADALVRLDAVEDEVRQVRVPWSYAEELYQLRLHIDYLRGQFRAMDGQAGAG